jgi:rod shape-determining protein MreC
VITTPFQKLSSSISGAATGFFDKFVNADAYFNENKKLREDITKLRKELVDYDKIKDENDQLKEIAGIKEIHDDFVLESASVSGRDPNDRYGSFMIDKGKLHGISARDPVMTSDGLVGYIEEVGATFSRVTTILSPEINVGSYEVRSKDTGVITGDISLAEKGLCKLAYLPTRESSITKGGMVVTSGLSGIFPRGIIVGIVQEVKPETHGISIYATISPAARITDTKNVFVIKNFLGKNSDDQKSGSSSKGSE